MDKSTRNSIQRATQAGRTLLERAFSEQLEGTFDILLDGTIAEQAGGHLSDRQKIVCEKLVATISHKRSTGLSAPAAVQAYLREAAFTTLNRFVALKMLEARDLVQECVSKGEDSSGFKEFSALAPGLVTVEDKGYRLYIETLFDEIGQEVKVLFDRRDVASLLWPDRQTLLDLLGILNAPELASVWAEDETIGWVYQYFNGDEERTQMRAESQAPRNSRELAVRNQFFTPRYVVQFLTDNTLGRTWYEMMQGKTKLAHLDYLVCRPNEVFLAEGEMAPESAVDDSEFSQEELLQQTVYVPFRVKKDPRDLRILDPACGSGHFLLYAFELLVSIYEEAWSDTVAAVFTETGKTLLDDFDNREALQRAVPELILRHNLHGVDIDPRAAQIAALALWMRAQRTYNQFDVVRAERPSITKTNIVVAEPMPGEKALVEEFAASLKPAVLGDLFKKMVEEMKLAGELGSLLKIEEAITKTVKVSAESQRQGRLFEGETENQEFWDTADEKIIAALANFSESAVGSTGTRRQLFSGDVAQGVAFIELMRKRFDTVLMNPPFGAFSTSTQQWSQRHYPASKHDIYAAFVELGVKLLTPYGLLGAITARTGLFLPSFSSWRQAVLFQEAPPKLVADLGQGVMDSAMVEAAAYCLEKSRFDGSETTIFFRALEPKDKAAVLRGPFTESTYMIAKLSDLAALPGSSLAYWIPRRAIRMYEDLQPFEYPEKGRETKCGLSTLDIFRFLRLRWEISVVSHDWKPYFGGGTHSPFYEDFWIVVSWADVGREVKTFVEAKVGSASRKVQAESYYFRPGFVFPRRTRSFCPKFMPAGGIFSTAGQAGFMKVDELGAGIGLLSSSACSFLLTVSQGGSEAPQFEVGQIKRLPWPPLEVEIVNKLELLSLRAWSIQRRFDTGNESSLAFECPFLLRLKLKSLGDNLEAWRIEVAQLQEELERTRIELNELSFQVYGFTDEDRELIEGIGSVAIEQREQDSNDDERLKSENMLPNTLVASLLSWSVGVSFGRFDLRLATGAKPLPIEPTPLDPLPICSPGMLAGDDGLLLGLPPADYPVSFPADGIFVDDQGHPADFVRRSRAIFEEVFDQPEARWNEAAELIRARNQDLRAWFAKDFFGYHIKQYSKSRRKAPIYWQLATPSASYSVWCYCHRLTRDAFFRLANDYVTPKVDHEERRLNALSQEAGHDPSSKQRKAIDAQETFVAELRAFKTEVTRIAPLWSPNLNDGVIINFAPLWRLVPQHKPWQKECKACWDKLINGDYDWAHLAMHLWPERVVPKCKDDRSLAIAHALEEDFWYEDDDGKWQEQQVSDDRIAELVAERSSKAVTAALKDLLEAPAPTGGPTRKKRRARS